jgi:tetratricopeptide (TPR) repeat protein
MSGRVVRVQPRASWPDKVVPGLSYVVTVDAGVDGDWPYEEEEFELGCTVDGSPGLAVEAVGNSSLVLHRFGGSYGPARFLLHVGDLPEGTRGSLHVTLFTAGGLPFHSARLQVSKDDIPARLPPPLTTAGAASARLPEPRRYSVEPLPPSSPPPYPSWPSRLLAAANEVVPFVLRDAELAGLAGWASGSEKMLVRLLYGPGGQGKTRLVTEFARRSAGSGWTVLMARPRPEIPAAAGRPRPGDEPPTGPESLLVIVDYAERWSAEDLLELLHDLHLREGRTRVLLQARTAGSWWEVVATELREQRIAGYATALPPLTSNRENRQKIYEAAVSRFAELYGIEIPPARLRLSADLDEPAFQQVLIVHMAALVLVDAAARGGRPVSRPELLSAALLERERELWDTLRQSGTIQTSVEVMNRVLFCAALTGPVLPAEAALVLDCTGTDPGGDLARVIRDHALCYPPADPRTVLEPLTPDRLTEDLLAGMIANEGSGPADPWAEAAVWGLLRSGEKYARSAISMMAEVARRWPAVGEFLATILRQRPDWGIAAGGSTLMALLTLPAVGPDVLERFERALPGEHPLSLDLAAVTITERLLASGGFSRAKEAGLYDRLSVRLSNLGRHAEALEAVRHAVELRRHLTPEDPGQYRQALADSLTNLSNRLDELGLLEDGLRESISAIAVFRSLAQADPRRFLHPLAVGLNNQSVRMGKLGDRDGALQAITEAVEIYRELARTQPESFLDDLAKGLCNRSVQLADTGQAASALADITEAVGIYRKLAEAAPETTAPYLASALSNYSNRLRDAARPEEALAAASEAVEFQRMLAEQRPEVYLPELARSLNNLANCLGDLGRFGQALAAMTQVVTINRRLTHQHPELGRPDLAVSLNNLAVQLRNLGNDEASLTAISEALDICRGLAEERSEVYLPELALTLNNYANHLRAARRFEDANAAITEAISLRREMVERRPAAFLPDLAVSLYNAAVLCADSGRFRQALPLIEESAAIRRLLVDSKPEIHLPELAAALICQANLLSELGEQEQADDLLDEALRIYPAGDTSDRLREDYERNLQISDWLRRTA